MSNLTQEQLQRIEAKRQEALQRKKARERSQVMQNNHSSVLQQTATSVLGGSNSKTSQGTFLGNVNIHQRSISQHRKRAEIQKLGTALHATFELTSRERFIVHVPFDAQVIDVFKSIQSRSYNPKTKQWSFHVNDHDKLMYELLMSKKVAAIAIPSRVLEIISTNVQDNFRNIDLSRIEPVLRQSLMPFQEEGICFGISKGGRCLLADDMGLGKTIQALGIAHYYREEWPLLIAAPSSVRYVWAESICKWLPSVQFCEIAVVTSSKDTEKIEGAKIVITSYNLMSRYKDMFKKHNFSVFILDESHYLKSYNSQRSKAAMLLLRNAKRIIMLTGTPALSRPQELYVQLSVLKPTLFSNMVEFGLRYCAAKRTAFGWDFSGSSNLIELRVLLETHLMIRRIKADVISQLPPKIRHVIILDPNLVGSRSKEITNSMRALKEESLKGLKKRGALLNYYFATGKAKVNAIKEYISELLEKGKKFICFAHHQIVLDAICNLIAEKGIEFVCIDGKVNSMERMRLCDKFQLDEKCMVAVLSITAAGTGITLTAAYLVVFAELYWNPGILIQAEDRAHRIGQTDSVLVQYLVAQDTADDHLWPLIQSKYNVLNKAGFNRDDSLETQKTILQSKKQDPEIVKYFEQVGDLDCEDENIQLANMEMEEVAPRRSKLLKQEPLQ